jgi:ABC-type polar amino acid transport system ATPase subunit
MVVVTHEMGFAREVADQVVSFDQRSWSAGRPRRYSDLRASYTQQFLTSVSR